MSGAATEVAAGSESEKKERKKTAAERFGIKPNPFGAKAAHSVVRSADFRRISTLPRRTHWVDYSEALTEVFAKPPRGRDNCPTGCPCKQTGFMKLRSLQGWALSEALENRGAMLWLGPGTGKAQPLDSIVYTPKGPARMGDLRIGDHVCTPDGGSAPIVGLYPQGIKDIYRVTFSDGTSVECCDEHLWSVRSKKCRKNDARNRRYVPVDEERPELRVTKERWSWQVKSLAEIRQTYTQEAEGTFDVPMSKPLLFDAKQLPIPAYTLGVLLGDGGLGSGIIISTGRRDCVEMLNLLKQDCKGFEFGPSATSNEEKIPIVNNERFYGPAARASYGSIQSCLLRLDLFGKRSYEKSIPDVYKYAAAADRFSIIQGLLDTDGTIGKNGCISFTTTSVKLSNDVAFLVQSLGGTCTSKSRVTKFKYKGVLKSGRRSYTTFIRLPEDLGCPVRLSFKKNRWRPLTKYKPARYIKNVELVGKKEAQCIAVDSADHLYITDGCVVTHNTLSSLLLSPLMGWQRPVLFVPASLRDKTLEIDYPLLSLHWHLPPIDPSEIGGLEVVSYDKLSRDYDDYLGSLRMPDGLIFDEIHALARTGSGRSKKIKRHLDRFPSTEVVGMTGSPVHRSVMDYGHLLNYSLKDRSPVPHSFIERKTWADVLDDGVPEFARPQPGALLDFCRAGETPREGYKRRLLEAPGVVSSPDLSTDIELRLDELPMPKQPQVIIDAFHRLRNTNTLPEGEVATTALDQMRHARELLMGFYYRWVWPGGVRDSEWLKKRTAWRKFVRKMTARSHGGLWLDTEAQVAGAVQNGAVECRESEVTPAGKILRVNVNVYEEWVECAADRKIKWGQREPPKEAVWLSDYMVLELERWSRENVGIIWIESIGMMDKLRSRGHTCFGAGENQIELESGKRSVFASLAHATGKNLQMFDKMLFANPLQSGKAFEQALGREHRPGQTSSVVQAFVYLGCRETWWALERSRMDARYIESTLGQAQRLNKAVVTLATSDEMAVEKHDNGDPLWAKTGHAKIDGKLGLVDPVTGVRADTATPILTALKAQAKMKEEKSEKKSSKKNKSSDNKIDDENAKDLQYTEDEEGDESLWDEEMDEVEEHVLK